jgi:hypothetical protein
VAEGRVLRATVQASPTAGPWTVRVTADADTWLVVDELRVGADSPQYLVGAPPQPVNPLTEALEATTAPPVIAPDARAATLADNVQHLPLPELAPLADDVLLDRLSAACSPVQVAPDSAPDAWIEESHRKSALGKPGARGFGHLGPELILAPPSDTMPSGPYRLRLDPRRKCDHGTWVYPNDVLTWGTRVAAAKRMDLGVNLVALDGIAVVTGPEVPEEAPLHVKVTGTTPKETRVLEGELRFPTAGGKRMACLQFDAPLPPEVQLSLTVQNPNPNAWFAIWSARIGESEHFEGCDP